MSEAESVETSLRKAAVILASAKVPSKDQKAAITTLLFESASEISRLRSALEEKDEALEPFARHGRFVDEQFSDHDDHIIAAGFRESPITLGDFRRAARVRE